MTSKSFPVENVRGGAVEAEGTLWDVVVVGTGMGGATVGYALAKAGRRVLFLERGLDLRSDPEAIKGRYVEDDRGFRHLTPDEQRAMLALGGRATDEFRDCTGGRSIPFTPYVGCGTGGSGSLFGMVMERLFPADFTPRGTFRGDDNSQLPESWPVTYEEFEPWYERAERLYRLRGTPDPLRAGGPAAAILDPPPISAENRELFAALEEHGVHPYRSHKACESVPGCIACQGFACGCSCKIGPAAVCLTPAIEEYGASMLTGCAAVSIEADGTEVREVVCRYRGRDMRVRGKLFVIAAGALMTPALLLNSTSGTWPAGVANRSGMVGRNLMRHCIDLYVLTRGPRVHDLSQARELIFNDYYQHDGRKLGSVQAFGVTPPLDYVRNQPGWNLWRMLGPAASVAWKLNSRAPILATILEDLPYPGNRVWPDCPPGYDFRLRVNYSYKPGRSEQERSRRFREAVSPLLRRFRPVKVFGTSDRKALGHVCGTCRFGSDSRTSVLDKWNRAHDLSNLYVVDSSFFPSSGGINPALTVAANALRVAGHLSARL